MNRRVFSVSLFAASILPTTAFPQSFLKPYRGLPYRGKQVEAQGKYLEAIKLGKYGKEAA